MPSSSKSLFQTWQITGATVFILVVAICAHRFWASLHQDDIWKKKVKRQIDIEEVRNWALRAMQFYSPSNAGGNFQSLLTNAPQALLENYRHRPQVILEANEAGNGCCVRLRYGGGMYDWGLTIGASDLSTNYVLGKRIEQWAPGIYYWNN